MPFLPLEALLNSYVNFIMRGVFVGIDSIVTAADC
jgi:hypothetical protein